MSEESVKRMAHFGFEIPGESNVDRNEVEKMKKIMEQAYNQYEQTKDILWCCLDGAVSSGGSAPENTEKLSPKDAFYAVTTEIHGLLVQCAQLFRFTADRARRLQDDLSREQLLRANAENRATLKDKDSEADKRLKEARDALDRQISDSDERIRAERARADALADKLRATEKELLVLRAVAAGGGLNRSGIQGVSADGALGRSGSRGLASTLPAFPGGPAPYLNTALLAKGHLGGNSAGAPGLSNSTGPSAGNGHFNASGTSAPAGTSPGTIGTIPSLSDYIFGPPGAAFGVPGAFGAGTMQFTEEPGPDGDLVTRRIIFKKEVLENSVAKLQAEKQDLESKILKYSRVIEAAKEKLNSGGLDTSEIEKLINETTSLGGKHEVEKLREKLGEIQQLLDREREARAVEAKSHFDEKMQLKKDWKAIYNLICTELDIKLQRMD